MKNGSVVVVGSANMDMVVTLERFPEPGETIFGQNFGMFPGGKGANQAVACAKLGNQTIFLGKMGNDIFKNRLVESMKSNGVCMDHLLIDAEAPTGIALIQVDDNGENQIVVVSGSNMKFLASDIESQKALLARSNVVLIQLEIPLETVTATAELVHQTEGIFILNPAPARTLPDELLSVTDYITPNENELALLTGKSVSDLNSIQSASKVLLQKGVKNIVVTLGDNGVFYANREHVEHFPAHPVTAVDSTAAGDAFNGALAFGLTKTWDTNRVIRFANAVAALSVTRMGAQQSMPTYEEVQEFVNHNQNQEGIL